MEQPKKNFFLEDIWNEGLAEAQQSRKVVARQHIWAGEIGKSFYERYLKMTGVQPTEEKDPRVLRKFAMGNLVEEMVGRALAQYGVLKTAQEHIVVPETDDMLKVTGRLDFVAGVSDWSESKRKIQEYYDRKKEMGDDNMTFGVTDEIAIRVAEQLSKRFPEGFADTPLEIKSVNSMLFWAKKDYLNEAYPHHIFQLYTYLKAKNLPLGRIVYFSKDDATIKEMTVKLGDPAIELMWKKDIKAMTKYIRDGVAPLKPNSIVFDRRAKYRFAHKKIKYATAGAWKHNWQVEWSDYFSLITGGQFETIDDWKDSLKGEISARNKELKAEFLKENNL